MTLKKIILKEEKRAHELALTLRLNNLIEENFKWDSMGLFFLLFHNQKRLSIPACTLPSLMTVSNAHVSVGQLNPGCRSCDAELA